MLASVEKFAYLVGDQSYVGQKVKILEISLFVLFILEDAVCEI
jgi:hypothetical protein